ncbi:MAG: VOC family protein [Candidatus Rokubacteria bacterium]|nr:VOC family protein [Candidatus Rokubacteria bacterium]
MSRGLRHLALKTRDLARTEQFYRDVIGLRRAFDHQGMLFLETPGGDDLLNFVGTRGAVAPSRGGLDHFGLSFTRGEWKKAVARVKEAGVKITGSRGASAIYIEDPNGYTIELYCD